MSSLPPRAHTAEGPVQGSPATNTSIDTQPSIPVPLQKRQPRFKGQSELWD